MAKKDLLLGSGKLYITKATVGEDGSIQSIPANESIETEANCIGGISGGATLSYSFEVNEVKDDFGIVYHRGLTSEEVTFKSGVLTWDLDNLAKLTAGGKVSNESGKRVLKIGGMGESLETYLIRFVHEMVGSGKKIRVTLCGNATSGFELAFNPEEETVIDAEFKAVQMEDGKTLVMIEQETEMAKTVKSK